MGMKKKKQEEAAKRKEIGLANMNDKLGQAE